MLEMAEILNLNFPLLPKKQNKYSGFMFDQSASKQMSPSGICRPHLYRQRSARQTRATSQKPCLCLMVKTNIGSSKSDSHW